VGCLVVRCGWVFWFVGRFGGFGLVFWVGWCLAWHRGGGFGCVVHGGDFWLLLGGGCVCWVFVVEVVGGCRGLSGGHVRCR